MSFSWGTTTEEQANEVLTHVPIIYIKGEYDFKVVSAEEKLSPSSGNQYISLKMKVYMPSGQLFAQDNMVDVPSMFFRRKRFWHSVGFPEKVNAPSEHYVNMEGKAKFDVELYYSQKHLEHRKKFIVVDYINDENNNNISHNSNDVYVSDNMKDNDSSKKTFEDDDIPF